jgi:hypothetical protein
MIINPNLLYMRVCVVCHRTESMDVEADASLTLRRATEELLSFQERGYDAVLCPTHTHTHIHTYSQNTVATTIFMIIVKSELICFHCWNTKQLMAPIHSDCSLSFER